MRMQRIVKTPAELGDTVAAVRIAQSLRADEFSVSHVCLSGIERGKATTQIGKVFEVLAELGIELTLAMPPGLSLPESKNKRRRITR